MAFRDIGPLALQAAQQRAAFQLEDRRIDEGVRQANINRVTQNIQRRQLMRAQKKAERKARKDRNVGIAVSVVGGLLTGGALGALGSTAAPATSGVIAGGVGPGGMTATQLAGLGSGAGGTGGLALGGGVSTGFGAGGAAGAGGGFSIGAGAGSTASSFGAAGSGLSATGVPLSTAQVPAPSIGLGATATPPKPGFLESLGSNKINLGEGTILNSIESIIDIGLDLFSPEELVKLILQDKEEEDA